MNVDFLTRQEDVPQQLAPAKPALSAMERVMLVILGVTLAAGCFLISSRHHPEAGQRPWRAGSILQPITQLMSLNFEYPTTRGTEIKWLVQGLGVAAALMAAIVGWYVWTRPEDPESRPAGMRPRRSLRDRVRLFFTRASLTSAAQIALMLFAGWTFLSALWAPWPAGAIGEAFRQLLPLLWAVILGRMLTVRSARQACLLLTGILALTSVIGIWYFYERNPGQRLKFPIGNPIFLGACLLPALILPMAWMVGWVEGWIRRARSQKPAGSGIEENAEKDSPAEEGAKQCSQPQALSPQPAGEMPASAGYSHPAQAAPASGVRLWIVLGSIVCLALTVWAFMLAGSRGPLVGLALGLVLMAGMASPRWLRWTLAGITFAGLIAVLFFVSTHIDQEGSRWATVRFRTYAWKYAVQRFIVRPVGGAGQGDYLLAAQAMSVRDAQQDPAAFVGELLGHAHNEWLEVLSDLGAFGLALISTALGITFWSAWLSLRRLGCVFDRWCLLGLAGTLAALIVEEMTDVALRTPVLPLIFYTVVGLIWAFCASAEKWEEENTERSHGRGVRVLGLLLGGAACVAIAWVVIADWQGARSQFLVTERLEKKDWPGALEAATVAEQMRLGIEDRLMAAEQTSVAAHEAAMFWFGELAGLAERMGEEGLSGPARQVAAENAARFNFYFEASKAACERILQRMPFFPHAAGRLAALWLLKSDAEQIEQQLGLREQARRYYGYAHQWLAGEYARAPFDADLGLRLLALTPQSEPLDQRLDLLRVPIRAGRIHPGVSRALALLRQEEDFPAVMNAWMAAAQTVAENPADSWDDPYAPETLRLAALTNELRIGELQALPAREAALHAGETLALAAESARLTEGAADLLLTIRARFPTAAAYARIEQARYQLLASATQPEKALAVYRQALAEWPAYGPQNEREALQEGLSAYLLAAGQEDQARENLKALLPTATDSAVDAQLALHLEWLNQMFITLPPAVRPAHFEKLVARFVELNTQPAMARLMAAQLALERGNDAGAVDHLEVVRQNSEPAQFVQAIRFLRERFPENAVLQLLAQQLFPPETQPATAPAQP
ncbi:MAG: O-antigen ligase family protein [Phycisphaerae bacterium]|nr:O-antigen ligase family protein [Phycisphaerae bacterium]